MKRFLLMMMAVAVVGVTSCSSEKDDDGGDGTGIVGRWEAVTDHELINGEWVLEETYSSGEWVWEFTSDGKLKDFWEGNLEQTYSYAYNASKKELTIAGMVSQVEKLTSTELVVIAKSFDSSPVTYKTTYKKN